MVGIKVTIERLTDDHFPGWVVCSFVDAAGVLHIFEEKVPVVTEEPLVAKSEYPRPGIVGCEVISSRHGVDGRELVLVDTEKPWGIESKAGTTRFEVNRDQLLEFSHEAG